jgi:acyl-CoA thioesterase YciA
MGHEGVKIPGREPVLRVMPMPADMNGNGDIFGGWVMAQCDVAAAIPAMRRRAAASPPSR